RMGGGNLIQLRFLLGDDAAHPLGDELVLRLEVPVERHLVRPRRFGDRLDADATNPHPTEQIVGRLENALTGWDSEFAGVRHGYCSGARAAVDENSLLDFRVTDR